MSPPDAVLAATALVKASLRGVDSHGVARTSMYCERLRKGAANPAPDIKVNRVFTAASMIDGDDGLGLVVGHRAKAEAISIAHECGIGLAGVKEQPRAEGFEEILMPGEPEARKEQERLTQGIPIKRDVFESLRSEGKRVGLPFPGS